MKMNNFLKLVICVAVSEMVGIVGSVFTVSSISTWYATLQKPLLNPPAWIFGPVWTTLYLLMGITLWLVWKSDSQQKRMAIGVFFIQLFLNGIWTPVFFGAHSIVAALAIILLLWVTIVVTMGIFAKISKAAVWLLVPYILWVSFAAYLNFALWVLN